MVHSGNIAAAATASTESSGGISPVFIVLIIVAAVLVGVIILLYVLGKKAEKKKAEQDEQIAAAAQWVTMLVIDKKRMKLKDSGLPSIVLEKAPKMARLAKLPIVKAKIGPKIMSLISDEKIFDTIPIKKEIKASVSGLYIVAVKGIRGSIDTTVHKKTFREKMMEKAAYYKAKSGKGKK
jgi:hypothetical protein